MGLTTVSRPVVLLLRGINVGRGHRVSMAELTGLLGEMGYADARTHLQSGNVLVGAGSRSADDIAGQVQDALGKRFGFAIPVIARTGHELSQVVAADPLGDVVDDPARYVATFLVEPPDGSAVRKLAASSFGRERFEVRGREVYQWCPGGQHKSPMVKALDKAGITSTGTTRNWRTVTRLAELARA